MNDGEHNRLTGTISSHPVIATFVLCLLLVPFAKGSSLLMSGVDLGITFGILTAFLLLMLNPFANKDKILIPVTSIVSALIFGVWGFLAGDKNLVITLGGFLVIAMTAAGILVKNKRLSTSQIIALFFALGFLLRFSYVQYTSILDRQNDVGDFLEGYFDPHHAGYIQYIMHYNMVPNIDVRTMDQWYHPPFYHIVCAFFMKVYGAIFPGLKNNYEVLQMLTLCYSTVAVIAIWKIFSLFESKNSTKILICAIINLFPQFTIIAGGINNDILATMLFIMAVYYGILWYREQKMSTIALIGLLIGLSMMTKISSWMVAVPVGVMFLVILFKNEGYKKVKLWGEYLVFAVIAFPLGLWFPIRNLVEFGVPFTYIFTPYYEFNDVTNYSILERIFAFQIPTESGYNILTNTIYTALFDDDSYRELPVFGIISFLCLFAFMVLLIYVLVSFVMEIISEVKGKSNIENISLTLLLIAEIVSYVIFCIKYPYICTMNYRYIIPITITLCLCLGRLSDRLDGNTKLSIPRWFLYGSTVIFCSLSTIFYLALWVADKM